MTTVAALEGGKVETFEVALRGCRTCRGRGSRTFDGGEPQHNARLMRDLLAGAGGPLRDVVLLNSGAALLIAGRGRRARSGYRARRPVARFGRGAAGAATSWSPAPMLPAEAEAIARMRDVLAEICAEKRAHVARAKASVSEAALLAGLAEAPPPRPFAAALERHLAEGRYGLIAEIKKASPSAGLIRERFRPAARSRAPMRRAAPAASRC